MPKTSREVAFGGCGYQKSVIIGCGAGYVGSRPVSMILGLPSRPPHTLACQQAEPARHRCRVCRTQPEACNLYGGSGFASPPN